MFCYVSWQVNEYCNSDLPIVECEYCNSELFEDENDVFNCDGEDGCGKSFYFESSGRRNYVKTK